MSSIFFARHGQSQANAQGVLAFPDAELTEKGRQQARDLAQELTNLDIVRIISSPMNRAISTARVVAESIGVDDSKIATIDSLRERNVGSLHGTKKQHPGAYYSQSLIDDIDGVETVASMIKRMQVCWSKLTQISIHAEGNILVVGHNISGYYLHRVSLGLNNPGLVDEVAELANASYVKLG